MSNYTKAHNRVMCLIAFDMFFCPNKQDKCGYIC